jgi:hypothetical protein
VSSSSSKTDPVKSSALANQNGNNTKLAVNLDVNGPPGTKATASMSSDDDLFEQGKGTLRRAILAA